MIKSLFKRLSFKITFYVFLIFTIPSAIALITFSWYLSTKMHAPWFLTMRAGILGLSVILIVCFLVFAFVLYRLLCPLGELKEAMQKVDLKDSQLPYKCESTDELGEIAGSFNDMVQTMRITSRELLRRIALEAAKSEIAPNPHILIDTSGVIISVNPAADRIFQYDHEELLGETIGKVIPPQGQKNQLSEITRRLRKQTETVGIRKNGERFPIDLYIGEATVEEDTIYVAIVEDITHRKLAEADHKDLEYRKKVEAELKSAMADAERANKAKSLFLSSMSHELRTPLNSILGYSQLLTANKNDPLTASQNEMTLQILQAGNHLLKLIDEVLDLSKIEAGDSNLDMTDVEVVPVVHELLAYINPMAEKYGIEVFNQISVEEEYIRADRTRFKQVLMNLLSNAVKYNKPRGKVFLSWEITADKIRFKVEDTGLGIPADKLESVYEPFDRAGAETSAVEGTGIGLTITKRLVGLMDGEIHVKSEVAKGSTFTVELSRLISPEKGNQEKSAYSGPAAIGDQNEIYTILYIEDNPSNLKLVQTVLQSHQNIRFLSAKTALSGIDLAISERPHLVLMDINLPDIDGFEARNRLSDSEQTAGIPVVALSANAMPEDIEKARTAGFTDYITKPININKFLATISAALTA